MWSLASFVNRYVHKREEKNCWMNARWNQHYFFLFLNNNHQTERIFFLLSLLPPSLMHLMLFWLQRQLWIRWKSYTRLHNESNWFFWRKFKQKKTERKDFSFLLLPWCCQRDRKRPLFSLFLSSIRCRSQCKYMLNSTEDKTMVTSMLIAFFSSIFDSCWLIREDRRKK